MAMLSLSPGVFALQNGCLGVRGVACDQIDGDDGLVGSPTPQAVEGHPVPPRRASSMASDIMSAVVGQRRLNHGRRISQSTALQRQADADRHGHTQPGRSISMGQI